MVPHSDRGRRRQPSPPQHLLDGASSRRTRWPRAAARALAARRPSVNTSGEAVEQRVGTGAGAREAGAARTARETSSSPPSRQPARRTARRTRRRGRSRGRAARRAAPACRAARAAAAARRCPRFGANAISACSSSTRARCELVQRPGLRGREQRRAPRRRRRPGALACGRRQHPLGAPRGVGVSVGGPPQERRRRGEPAATPAPARPSARARRRRPRPGRARPARDATRGDRGRASGSRDLRQRPVHAPALGLRRRRAVDRRPHERVAEADARADVQQRGRSPPARAPRVPIPSRVGRAPHAARRRRRAPPPRRSISRRVVAGSALDAPQVVLLDLAGQVTVAGSPNPPASSAGLMPRGQLQQRERVAARLGDDAIADALVEPARDRPSPAARARPPRPGPPSAQLRQAVELVLGGRLADGEARSPPTPPAAAGRRSRGPGPRRRRATARRRRGRAAAAPRRPSASRLSTASATRKRSGASPEERPSATRSASRCGSGSASSRPSIGAQSRCRPANGSSISASTPAICATRKPAGLRGRSNAAARSCRRPPRHGRRAPRSGPADVVQQPVERLALAGPAPATPAGGGRPCTNPNRLVRHCQAGSGWAPLRCPRHRPAGPSRGRARGRPRPRPRAGRGR